MICRNCGAGFETESIDSSLGLVTCSHCGTLHDLPRAPQHVPTSSEGPASRTKPERVEVALPKRFKIHRAADAMEITWPVGGGLLQSMILLIMAGAFSYSALMSNTLLLLIPSTAIVYFAAVRAFNKHRIRVDKAQLNVTQGPLPWKGNRRIDSANVAQLYTTEHKTRTEPSGDERHGQNIEIRIFYRLNANTKNNQRITVLNGLHDPFQALWLEQEIEKLLAIKDTQITGEYFR